MTPPVQVKPLACSLARSPACSFASKPANQRAQCELAQIGRSRYWASVPFSASARLGSPASLLVQAELKGYQSTMAAFASFRSSKLPAIWQLKWKTCFRLCHYPVFAFHCFERTLKTQPLLMCATSNTSWKTISNSGSRSFKLSTIFLALFCCLAANWAHQLNLSNNNQLPVRLVEI